MPFSLTQQQELEDAFRKLPPGVRRSTGIPYETSIPGIARELLISKCRDEKKDPAQQSLKNLRRASARLVKVLDELSPEVLNALSFMEPKIKALQKELRLLKAAAGKTEVRGKRGASEKVHPYKIAQTVGWHYFCLTGRDPTISRPEGNKPRGAFFDLLTTVYRVLVINASADSQEKKLKKEWPLIKERFQKQFAGSEFNRQEIGS
jgi:hypothetical protein